MGNRGKRQLRPGFTEWGQLRVAADLSLRDLERATRINSGLLSMLERGRWLPSPDEANRILTALAQAKANREAQTIAV
jgi:transcriptional regulator with XRE-family HTH domain